MTVPETAMAVAKSTPCEVIIEDMKLERNEMIEGKEINNNECDGSWKRELDRGVFFL